MPLSNQVGDAAVGLLEGQVEQLARVDLGQPRAYVLGGVLGEPAVRRVSMSTALRVRQISTAVAVHSGRSFSDWEPRCRAVRSRSASLVAGSAASAPPGNARHLNDNPAVVAGLTASPQAEVPGIGTGG
jgi:hypothetical protein